ncbi:MAG: alkane 1-monooxygenase [Candidatus Tectimicrobiota bacterium]
MTTRLVSSPLRQRWSQLGNLGFMLVYGIPALLIGSTWLGAGSAQPQLWVWVPLAIGYVLVPLLQALWPYPAPLLDAGHCHGAWLLYHRCLLWFSLPAQLGMLYVATDYAVSGPLQGWSVLGHLLTTGVFSAIFAINISHELIHRPQALDRLLGGLLLSTVCFGTFKVVHVQIHHRYVATPFDFATARRGQSIYAFWWQCWVGNVRDAWHCERARLAKLQQPWWRSELLAWYSYSLLWLTLALALWGWQGGLFFLAQALLAIMKLDCINYLQHYGLTRRLGPDRRYEPVQAQHAWSQGLFVHDLLLLNLFRHGDHHAHPQLPYHLLRADRPAPQYPYNYALMVCLIFVPRLFQAVVHPILDSVEVEA